MKKLWLSAVVAACLLTGTAAHAGEHGRGDYGRGDYGRGEYGRGDYDRHDNDRYRGWEHRHEYRDRDDYRWHHRDRREYRRVEYRPVYYSRPAYYGYYGQPLYRVHYYDNDVHGSISVNF